MLGSVSRVASINDISKWNITKIDTLEALMKEEDGEWEAAKVKCAGIVKKEKKLWRKNFRILNGLIQHDAVKQSLSITLTVFFHFF